MLAEDELPDRAIARPTASSDVLTEDGLCAAPVDVPLPLTVPLSISLTLAPPRTAG